MSIIAEQFDKFYEKIKLTKRQRKDAKKKYTGVCEKLHNSYYSTKYVGTTKKLFGSYGKMTNVRPPRDVDVMFILPPELYDRYSQYQSNGQAQLLQDIKKILAEKYTATEDIRAWGKIVLVKFADGTHNVELLPAFERTPNQYTIPNSENGGSWEIFDPISMVKTVDHQNSETGGLTRKLARFTRAWQQLHSGLDFPSYRIDEYVVEFLSFHPHYVSEPVQEVMKNFFEYLLPKFISQNRTYIETALLRAQKALEFEQDEKYLDAVDEWRKVLGDNFPRNFEDPDAQKYWNDKILALAEHFPSAKEEFLDSKYGIQFAINTDYILKIDTNVQQDGFRRGPLSLFLKKHWMLVKEKSLIFEVVECNVEEPYELYWKVRNFGEQAKLIGELRGEITKDTGKKLKQESTRYKGEHYVECYCVKDGVCVAIANILVPII